MRGFGHGLPKSCSVTTRSARPEDLGAIVAVVDTFTGVAAEMRWAALARSLCERFLSEARRAGRTVVKAVTSPHHMRSFAFHTALGFACSEPVADYDGPAQDRVGFPAGGEGQRERTVGTSEASPPSVPFTDGPLRSRARGVAGAGRSRWCMPCTRPTRGGRPGAVPAAASRCHRSAGRT